MRKNKQTFNCTLCKQKEFDKNEYIKHILNRHRDEKGICAICKCQSFGDLNPIINIYEHINIKHILEYDAEKDIGGNKEIGEAMIKHKEIFKNIIVNDKENKLYDFQKNFLIKYIKSNLNLGKLFEKKIGKYFQNLIEQPKLNITFHFASKDPEKIILQSMRIDFAACLLDYLEDKYIVLNDSTDKKDITTRILTLEELKKYQSNMLLELNKIMELIEDEETKNFIIDNIGTNENIANFIFSSRLFLESDLKRLYKVKIKVNPDQKDISKIKYEFLDSNENVVFSTFLGKKKFGIQFGGIITIESKQNKERLFFKTHQNGSRFTNYTGVLFYSKSISLAKPVNIRELLIYKVLEKLGMGPEVKFVVNPFIFQDLYIVTKDLSNDKSNEIFTISANLENDEKIEKLINDKDLILEFTKFDLINRILSIDDLNPGNYGILSKDNKNLVKIIDFKAPNTLISLGKIILDNFVKARGEFYKKEDFAIKILSNRKPEEKFKEGLAALKSIDYENFKKILISSKEDIVNFITQKDEVSYFEIKQQIGLDDEVFNELDDYIKNIQNNFELAMNYFLKNSS